MQCLNSSIFFNIDIKIYLIGQLLKNIPPAPPPSDSSAVRTLKDTLNFKLREN